MNRRIKRIELLINLTDDFSDLIRFNGMTVAELVNVSAEKNLYSEIDFLKKISYRSNDEYDIHSIWKEETEKSQFLKSDEREIMLMFGEMLGTSDISSQISSIEFYRKKLEYLHTLLQKEYESKGRMYCSVGLLSGITAGILLL